MKQPPDNDVPPWIVAFVRFAPGGSTDLVECAGTLVNPWWVLTAAHAVIDPRTTTALIGVGKISAECPRQMRSIEKVLPNPEYRPLQTPPPSDLALVRLTEPIYQGETGRFVNLAAETGTDFSPRCEVFGWGQNSADPRGQNPAFFSRHMKQIAVTVVPPVQPLVPETFQAMAASALTTCYGDSGGPLIFHHQENWIQIGITSSMTVKRECRSNGIYTAVAPHRRWIEQTIANDKS